MTGPSATIAKRFCFLNLGAGVKSPKTLRKKGGSPEISLELVDPADGRIEKRRRATRARLLAAAYEIMTEVGVDAAKIKDITDRADVGFGTFYNYFETKDMLASQVLDCAINDFGRRNDIATRELWKNDLALVMPVSMRLVMQDAMRARMWRWWALRPDLLVDRMREGFRPFGIRDIQAGIDAYLFQIDIKKIDTIWSLAIWMMVGGIHDVAVGKQNAEAAIHVADSVMRLLGVPFREAKRISSSLLPKYPAPNIDWNFEITQLEPDIRLLGKGQTK
jgi:AcrR family transcriptional regulator